MRVLIGAAVLCVCAAMAGSTYAGGPTVPAAMCDDGVFIVGDTAYSYEDIAVESTDAIALNDKGLITAYGYPELIHFGDELNDPVKAKLATVNECLPDNKMLSAKASLLVDLLLDPVDYTRDGWKAARRELLKAGDGLFPQALAKMTGTFGIFSDTGGLYFRAKSIEVIDVFR